MDLKKFIRERDQLRRVFNRHEVVADTNIDLEFLKEKIQAIEVLDRNIHDIMLSCENFDESEYDRDCVDCDEIKLKWLKLKDKLNAIKFAPKTEGTHFYNNTNNLNLPKIDLRKFDDNPKSWLPFWGQFKKIHEDANMDAETKFQYLTQAMTSDSTARALVESYPPTEENYSKVIKTLKDRFAKDETLIEIYVRELLNMITSKQQRNLDSLYDNIVTNLQILETLGIVRNQYECILLPLIESVLPESLLLAWCKVPHREGSSKLTQLLEFLQVEVEAERRVKLAYDFIQGSTYKEPTAMCLVNKQVTNNEKPSGTRNNMESKIDNCYFCDKQHNSLECNKIGTLSLDDRKMAIKIKGGCYICLKRGHFAKSCRVFVKCLYCNNRHLVILCPTLYDQVKLAKDKDKLSSSTEDISTNISQAKTTTVLQTLIVKITGNQERNVRVLLDSGSQRTYIKTKLAEELGLKVINNENVGYTLFGGVKKPSVAHRVFNFRVSNIDNSYSIMMKGLEQETLCGDLPKVYDVTILEKLSKQNIHLSDSDKNVNCIKDVDILIGSDHLGSILDNVIVHITDSLVAIKTKLGWTLQGPIEIKNSIYTHLVNTCISNAVPHIENQIEFLWDIETLGIKDPYNKEENNTPLEIKVNEEGRYEVSLIWKEGPQLSSNYEQAKKRLFSTTKKLENMKMLEGYDKVFKDWQEEGIIRVVEGDDHLDGHYLPHHAVIKLESTTTKIRPVFDASCKDENKRSLNSCIEKGGNLIELIPKLMILFRVGKFGVISDIKKAFLQISVTPTDRKYLKLLWWQDFQKKSKMITYQHTRVPFGVTCSPYLLAATLKHHLENHINIYPETAKRLRESFYVDNCVTSLDSEDQVTRFIQESKELMEKGKFELRGWMTNSLIDNEESEKVSVLGIQWERGRDELSCNLKLKPILNKITKRVLLSITQQIFDPIGFLCPTMLIPKLIIQKVWLLSTDWDEDIPEDLANEYKAWFNTICYVQQCKIPRRISEGVLYDCNISVHVFCDASKSAYAGCVFLRTECEGKITVRLILAKSRVAPTKRQMTLPRLELMGALIASRLYHEVHKTGFLNTFRESSVFCWTDSAVVLAWLKRQETWKTFVTNRVTEICVNTNKADWHHLPGQHNPADICSRGCDTKTLLESHWWTGPEWLYQEKEKWPKSAIDYTKNEEEVINGEQKKVTLVNVDICLENFSNKLLYFNQYNKIVRLIARLLRMSPKIRKLFIIDKDYIGFKEHRNAEERLIKLIQRESFTEFDRTRKRLVIIEEDGLLKVKTRLQYSEEDKNFILPILLPGKNAIVQRMVREKHVKMCHAGTQILLATLRNNYWILGIRKLVKDIVSGCIICKRYKTKHNILPQPPLPADRIRNTVPFEVTGIDLAGPLFLKNTQKCWIVLFTCAVFRAVHLELTESLSTNSFLMTLRRFISRRGRPKVIYTDHGTNFVGAANALNELNWPEIEEVTNCYKIQWQFSVPTAPWWGGWWERLIRVIKEMLRRILGKASIDWIELSTILCDCEVVINSRPLTYVEMGDTRALTPLLFLQGISTSDTPDLDEIDKHDLRIRYKYLQKLREDFRKRFRNEYLSLLVSKEKETRSELKIGELVLIETEKGRLHWPLGIITQVYSGRDGLTRVATVRTASGEKVRPYQRLYPLELSAVSEDWLNAVPVPSNTDTLNKTDDGTTRHIPISRSGRQIKLPSRFME